LHIELPNQAPNSNEQASSAFAGLKTIPSGRGRGHLVGIVGILTVLVAIVGYIREAVFAVRFGVSSTSDAYFGAILIPNILYAVLVTGTLSPVLVPILLHDNKEGERRQQTDAFSVVTSFIVALLMAVVGIVLLTMRFWLPLLFSGFSSATLKLTADLLYMILPGLVFLGLSGVLTAALNTFHKFAMAAFAPAVSSTIIILAILFAPEKNAIYVVGISVAVGFFLQALVLVPSVAKLGIRYRPTLNFRHPAISKLLRLGIPLILYLLVSNGAMFIERNLASQISAGAVATLSYALRLFLVPANFLAAPLATVAYPHFAREALREGFGELRAEASRVLRLVLFLFLPATVWVILNALPVTRLLYEHGRFTFSDSILTAKVLSIYALGILPYAMAIIVLRCLYALQDTMIPLWVELFALAYYTVSAIFFSRHFGLQGLVFARATEFILVSVILFVVLHRRLGLRAPGIDAFSFLVRAVCASAVMGVVLWASSNFVLSGVVSNSTVSRLVVVLVQLALGTATYAMMALLLKLREASQAVAMVRGLFETAKANIRG
jgi:putative peptidoglycan lipid II flippase